MVALEEAARGDHLGDVEPGAELAAQRAERVVGDAGHGRQHDRGPHAERAERAAGGTRPARATGTSRLRGVASRGGDGAVQASGTGQSRSMRRMPGAPNVASNAGSRFSSVTAKPAPS